MPLKLITSVKWVYKDAVAGSKVKFQISQSLSTLHLQGGDDPCGQACHAHSYGQDIAQAAPCHVSPPNTQEMSPPGEGEVGGAHSFLVRF